MNYRTAVGQRTRSRSRLQDLERNNQRNTKHSGEESWSDYTSEEEEGHSMDSDSDYDSDSESDVVFIDEHNHENISVDDNGVVVVLDESDVDVIPVDVGDEDEDGDENVSSSPGQRVEDVETRKSSACVAQRTRSHYNSRPRILNLGLGTSPSLPLCLDEEEEESESIFEQGGSTDDAGKTNHIRRKRKTSHSAGGIRNRIVDDNRDVFFSDRRGSESDEENISGDEGEGLDVKQKAHRKGERMKCSRKKQKAVPKGFNAVKILLHSLCAESQMSMSQNIASSSDEEGHKEPKSPEKSHDGKELDKLWDEMDECLCASEHDSDQVNHVWDPCPEDEVSSTTSGKTKVSRATLCQRGEHDLILNEEIGLTCKYCSHVSLEIKYCDPPFFKNRWGNSDRRDSCTLDNDNHPVFNDFELPIPGCDDYSFRYGNMSIGTVWDLIPGVKKSMFPHQCEAFEFLWMNLAGGIILDKLKKDLDFASGSGCIISHAPGTGKTRLTIVFLQTFLKFYQACRPMIIAPSNMLLTWEEEFEKWKVGIPFHNLNNHAYSKKENEVAIGLLKQHGSNVNSKMSIRLAKLYSWSKGKSILGISYTLFEKLAGQSSDNKDIKKALLEFPGLVVLDEGHTPRNAQSLLFQALSEIKTQRRIILSGTPFQNNFDELFNTLCMVKPKFAEWNTSGDRVVVDEKGGRRLFNSFSKVKSVGEKDRILKDIRRIINPSVHLYKGSILQESLPGLRELVVILKPTQLQKELLDYIQKMRKGGLQSKETSLKLDYRESLAAVHPSICLTNQDKEKLGKARLNPENGVKTKFLMELIRLSELMNEKVLVFSEFVAPLTFLSELLNCHFSWTEGREMLKMTGKDDAGTRQDTMKAFNDPTSQVRVLLASTKASSEGISLVGASRVVLLDVVWNPSVERQAVSRAYRLGQKKLVYTYRLITSGTRDEHKCSRQAEKDQLSELVFFSSHHRRNFSSADLEDKLLQKIVHNENFTHIVEKVTTNRRALL